MSKNDTYTRDEIEQIIDDVRQKASQHNEEYGAGMRLACIEIKENLDMSDSS